jgi:hypothetical protein
VLIPRFNFSARANASEGLALAATLVCATAQPANKPDNNKNATCNFIRLIVTRSIFIRFIAGNPFWIDTLTTTTKD